MSKDFYKEPIKVVRLWVHEAERVLSDRMISDVDMVKFSEFRVNVTRKYFDEVNQVGWCEASKAQMHLLPITSAAEPGWRACTACRVQAHATNCRQPQKRAFAVPAMAVCCSAA